MERILWIIFLVWLFEIGSVADTKLRCYKRRCYYLHDDIVTWQIANISCHQQHTDGRLVEIMDSGVDVFLNESLERYYKKPGRNRRSYWIGGHEQDLRGWKWVHSNVRLIGMSNADSNDTVCAYFKPPQDNSANQWQQSLGQSVCWRSKLFICKVCSTSSQCSYVVNESPATWFQAVDVCQHKHNGQLFYLDGSDLMDIKKTLENIITTDKDYWVGAHCTQWKWQSGGGIVYSHWDPESPSSRSEGCLEMREDGTWNDAPCNDGDFINKYICSGKDNTSDTNTIGSSEKDPTSDDSRTNQNLQKELIAGVAVAAIVLVIIIVLLAAFLIRRRRREKANEKDVQSNDVTQTRPSSRGLSTRWEHQYDYVDGFPSRYDNPAVIQPDHEYASIEDESLGVKSGAGARNRSTAIGKDAVLPHKMAGPLSDMYTLPNNKGNKKANETITNGRVKAADLQNELADRLVAKKSKATANTEDATQLSVQPIQGNRKVVDLGDETLIVENDVYNSCN